VTAECRLGARPRDTYRHRNADSLPPPPPPENASVHHVQLSVENHNNVNIIIRRPTTTILLLFVCTGCAVSPSGRYSRSSAHVMRYVFVILYRVRGYWFGKTVYHATLHTYRHRNADLLPLPPKNASRCVTSSSRSKITIMLILLLLLLLQDIRRQQLLLSVYTERVVSPSGRVVHR